MPQSSDDTQSSDVSAYRVSSFSGGGNCVEVRQLENGDIVVRDSRDRSASIVVRLGDWRAFTHGVKNGEFDFTDRC